MHQFEQALKLLTGRPFKKFLREHTAHPIKGADDDEALPVGA